MNARERIAKALFAATAFPDDVPILWEILSHDPRATEGYYVKADAVLAGIAELLTDERVLDAATVYAIKEANWTWEAEPHVPSPGEAMRPIIAAAFDGAAKALTEQEEQP